MDKKKGNTMNSHTPHQEPPISIASSIFTSQELLHTLGLVVEHLSVVQKALNWSHENTHRFSHKEQQRGKPMPLSLELSTTQEMATTITHALQGR